MVRSSVGKHGQLFLARLKHAFGALRHLEPFAKPPPAIRQRGDGERPEIGPRYFVAHVAQISRGNAQANAVNSTDLAWSRLVRDQEDGGSNPLAPTNYFAINNLRGRERSSSGWPGPGGRWLKSICPTTHSSRSHIDLHRNSTCSSTRKLVPTCQSTAGGETTPQLSNRRKTGESSGIMGEITIRQRQAAGPTSFSAKRDCSCGIRGSAPRSWNAPTLAGTDRRFYPAAGASIAGHRSSPN